MEHEPRKPQLEELIGEIHENEDQEWQDLIDSVEATDVPLEMLKYLRVHMNDGTRMIFPIVKWNKEGVKFDEIKNTVTDWYKRNDKQILGSDFIVNLTKLKKTVKLQTLKTLKDL